MDLTKNCQLQKLLSLWIYGAPGLAHPHPGGEEDYLISGTIRDEYGTYAAGTWLRQPPGSAVDGALRRIFQHKHSEGITGSRMLTLLAARSALA